jgi:hypothetical protein
MNGRATIAMLAVLASLGLGLAACGGDSGGDKLSRSELAAKADAICRTGEKDAEDVEAPSDFADPVASFAYFDKIVPLHQKQTDSLEALTPADDAKADWDAFIAAQRRNNELLITIRDKAKAKDRSGADDLRAFSENSRRFSAAAAKVGSKACAGTA